MAIKNYTTKVDVYTSIGEIQGALARHGATKIMIDYDNGKPQAIAFGIDTPVGPRGFRLPAAVDGTLRVFAAQKIKADREQAEMTAWRNVRDWVLAQMMCRCSRSSCRIWQMIAAGRCTSCMPPGSLQSAMVWSDECAFELPRCKVGHGTGNRADYAAAQILPRTVRRFFGRSVPQTAVSN